jgi:predicted nicotinamide N-methyase
MDAEVVMVNNERYRVNGDVRLLQSEISAFILAYTTVDAPPLCPEITLHLASALIPIWEAREAMGTATAPPYWATAWAGGQALARYVLDHRESVLHKSVLDLGSGSGVCAIAAAKAGATEVQAAELDPFALRAIAMNAALNAVTIHTISTDMTANSKCHWDVVLAGDLWYERLFAERATAWLRDLATNGCVVLLGDMRRNYFPKQGIEELARYSIATSVDIERDPVSTGIVWRMLPSGITAVVS